ncbi:MAG: hypothetical protein MUF00_05275 [Gemmatimonadaceae bacterium]|jgi:hypothetical protein|nr:hypothetical protein [Gemmatimonadaceae bacterium]
MHHTPTAPSLPPDVPTALVEWAPFRLADGVTESELVAASDRLHHDVLRHQPGFLRRELLRGEDGQWADLVFWADRAAADNVMALAAQHPAFAAYFACMQHATLHFAQRVRIY